ncbi:hypothetical protein [Streptomyces sp. NPDC001642]|uniref:hypothetical protein n=1 Tax=Streptomyces sp. NPDC001642 TaxID=3154392 RepID=UPI00331E2C36
MLVLVVEDGPGTERTEQLAVLISDLVQAHAPMPAVVVIKGEATDAVVDAVVDAHRRCRGLDVLMSVATVSAPARRALQARADAGGGGLVVHARVDTAIATAGAIAARPAGTAPAVHFALPDTCP